MLELRGVSKSYSVADFAQVALDDVSVAFRDNEFVAILGPSGSGKTTLLNIIGGLDHYDSGALIIDGINTSNYTDRDWDTYRNNRIGFVFQAYNLIPHQTVLANVELALTLAGVSHTERRERALAALAEVGLEAHINKKPSQLSGGQMQRVAIARALVNDPEILLADEPTGALDSTTSVQIMDLLGNIAQDRLVVMVTHNPELAEEYATRTVELRDGRIVADTDPFDPGVEAARVAKPSRRTSMSFLTAVALSFNNLMTKKGRTLMTAFAGSIGIIGIAAILALANGVNSYIKAIEEDTLSVYPLSILSQGMDMTALLAASADMSEEAAGQGTSSENDVETPQGRVQEIQMISRMFSSVGANDLAALKEYLDEDGGGIDQYTNLIQYTYNVTPQIYLQDVDGHARQVSPDSTFTSLGFPTDSPLASSMRTDAFDEMMDDASLVEEQYDVKAGRWPASADEVVVVLTPSGGISDFTLYSMGLKDPAELDRMVTQVISGERVESSSQPGTYTYGDLMGVTFRLVPSSEYYQYDQSYGVWTDKSGNQSYVDSLVSAGSTLKVSGVVQPRAGATATALPPGIYYTPALTRYLIEEASESEVVQAQLAAPQTDIFTGRTFAEEAEDSSFAAFDMSKLFTIDEDAIKDAFTFDESILSADLSSLDLSDMELGLQGVNLDQLDLPSLDLSEVASQVDFGADSLDVDAIIASIDVPTPQGSIDEEQIRDLADQMASGYLAYCIAGNDCTDAEASFQAFLGTEEGKAVAEELEKLGGEAQSGWESTQKEVADQLVAAISKQMESQVKANAARLQVAIQATVEAYVQQVMYAAAETVQQEIAAQLQSQLASAIGSAMQQVMGNLSSAVSVDPEALAAAFQPSMDEEELAALVVSMLGQQTASYDNNLAALGYADLDRPYGIDIYPKDFEGKAQVVSILDTYNEEAKASGNDDKVITYTDLVGTLMASVTEIVNVVSYVLIAFVAISLAVSSIMIGVITYISVLERKKEIGILRSVGASKRDIRTVFNAETLIVGFVAGLMGILATLILTIPANAIVYAKFGVPNVAMLPWQAALILIAISMALTFLAGLIPSSAASRKDPVEALRSD